MIYVIFCIFIFLFIKIELLKNEIEIVNLKNNNFNIIDPTIKQNKCYATQLNDIDDDYDDLELNNYCSIDN